jgi:hypothetical protein
VNSRRRIPDPAPDAINKNVSNFRHMSKRLMSGLGQERTSRPRNATSALPPKTDITNTTAMPV